MGVAAAVDEDVVDMENEEAVVDNVEEDAVVVPKVEVQLQ